MPVSGIDATAPTVLPDVTTTPSTAPSTTVQDDAFARLLQAEQSTSTDGSVPADPSPGVPGADPSQQPTVSLAQMLASFAGADVLPDGPGGVDGGSEGVAGVQAASGPSDAWGAAADRPASAISGPGSEVLAAGERYLGVPYKWGGTSASEGFDCSGFVQQVYADLGVSLPRVSADQSRAGREVPGGLDAAQPGDLVFWNGNGGRPNHIGIYAGEGKMLVAPSTGDVVRYQEITRTPHAVRRVL